MYEKLRNELMSEMMCFTDHETIQNTMAALDIICRHYIVTESEVLPVVRDAIPNEVKYYIASKTIEGLAEGTLQRYLGMLTKFFQFYSGKSVQEITTNDIRIYLYEYQNITGNQNQTMDKLRSEIGIFFRWCKDEKYIESDPSVNIGKIKSEYKQRQALTRYELESMRELVKNNTRVKAYLEIMYSTGCRISEVTNIKLNDINWLDGSIKVFGKGKKHRVAFMNDKCRIALTEYLQKREGRFSSEYLFVRERSPHGKLSVDAIRNELEYFFKDFSRRINKPITPHVIRHTTATHALQAGMPIEEISKMLGHSSIGTTMIYAEVDLTEVHNSHKRCIV